MASENLDIIVRLKDEASRQLKSISASIDDAYSSQKKTLDSITGASQKFTAGILAMGAALSVAAVSGLKFAADMETAQVGLGTLLGSTEEARKVVERLKTEAARTPFELKGLTQATQLLTSVTKDGNKSIDIILDIGEALAAMGKGQNELDRIIVNLQQVAAVGKASMVDIKQFAYAGIPIFEMLQEKTSLSGDALQKFIADGGVTFGLLTEMFDKANDSGGRFYNAFIDQAGSMNQLLSNFGDTVGITSGKIAEQTGLFSTAKEAIRSVTQALSEATPSIISFINSAKDNLPIIVGVISGGLVPAIAAATAGFIAMNASLLPFLAVGAIIGVAVQAQFQLASAVNQSKAEIDALNASMKNMEVGAMMISGMSEEMTRFSLATKHVNESMQDVNVTANQYQAELSKVGNQLWNLIGIETESVRNARIAMDGQLMIAAERRKIYAEEMKDATIREKALISSEKLIGETRQKIGYEETARRIKMADAEIKLIEQKTEKILKSDWYSEEERAKIKGQGFKEIQNLLNRELQYTGKITETKERLLRESGMNEIAIREIVANTNEKQLAQQLKTASQFHIANSHLLQQFLKVSAEASSKELIMYGQKYQRMGEAAASFRNGLASLFNKTIFQEIKLVVTDENTSIFQKIGALKDVAVNAFTQMKNTVQSFSASVGAINAEFDSALTGMNAGAEGMGKAGGAAGKAKEEVDKLKESMDKLNESYEKNLASIQEDMADFEEQHRKNTQNISRELSSIAEEMTKVQRAYKAFLTGEAEDFGGQFVKTEQNIRDIEKAIADAKHNMMGADDGVDRARYNEEIRTLQERLEKEKLAVQEANTFILGTKEENAAKVVELEANLERTIQDQRLATNNMQWGQMEAEKIRLQEKIAFFKDRENGLAEEQRRLATGVANARIQAGQSDWDNFIDKMVAKRNEERIEFERQMGMLEAKYQAVTAKLELERQAYMKGKEDFISIEAAMVRQHEQHMTDMYNATKEKVDEMIKQYERLAQASGNIGGAKLSGRRATGGGVNAGGSYLVGEAGPEIFTPNMNGKITANKNIGGATVVINIGKVVGNEDEAREIMGGFMRDLARNGVL